MKNDTLWQADQYMKAHRRKNRWYKVVTCLAAVVVFCTTYALILPAITLETACGLEEHTHTEDCYTQVTSVEKTELVCTPEAHIHTADCYDADGNPVCGYGDFVIHTHNDSCYDAEGNLICRLPEIEAHTHTESCYAPEGGHTHTEECYTTERGALICELAEEEGHTHDEACYDEDGELICQLPETEGHTHTDECYEQARVLTCGLKESEPELVLICDKPEAEPHTHDETCYDGDGNLICGKPEVLEHVHTDSCFQIVEVPVDTEILTCTLPEDENHTHTALCYGTWELTCGLEEHVHTEECAVPKEQSEPLSQLEVAGDDYVISVLYGPSAALPEGVTLTAREILPGTEEYQSYYDQAIAAIGENETVEVTVFARFFDIQFQLDGQEVEPASPVSVTITYDEPVQTGENVNCQAVHFAEDGTEILDVSAERRENGSTSFTHTQDGFSVVGDVVTASANYNSTDVGPNALPVDYYVCIDNEWVCVGSTKTGWYGDYTAASWTDYNRDYITVAQAESILGAYGFTGTEENLARVFAYQRKAGDTLIYSDTNSVDIDGQKVIPLARQTGYPGYNLYYLPANTEEINAYGDLNAKKAANGFYTVKVYDAHGALITSEIVKTGGRFTYAAEVTVDNWLVAYSGGTTETATGSTIVLTNITSAVTISPKKTEAAEVSHSVTFKVMIDGQWQTVGSLPYYYSGTVNGQQRAYITSDMAAQFFGDFGYTATMDPAYHFGYSYNDIYEIYYDSSNYCIDIIGGNISEGTKIQLYTSNHTDAQIFRIWQADGEYYFITPVTNSSLHINVEGGSTANDATIFLHSAIDYASQWKLKEERNGTVSFWTRNAPDSANIDLDKGTLANGTKIHLWTKTENRYWKLVQQYRISNNSVSAQNSDGTYNIGLTAESNGDIVCYYLPSETTGTYADVAESAIATTNSFWSVSVRDDTNTVYSDGELSGMVQYVAPGGEATVTVANADGILWSCVGANDVTTAQSGGYTTFTIKNITQPVEVVATKANPSFTVQYYANIPRFATSGSNPLTVIDTSGRILPTNGGSMATKNLYLEAIGQNTNQNAGDATQLYKVATTMELTKMYSDGTFQYQESPGLYYFNKLKDNESYTLTRVGVLKAGKDPASTNNDDWTWYQVTNGDIGFTNLASEASDTNVLINDGAVIRLWFDAATSDYYNGTTFYDYNISSGQNSDGRWRTGITGINSESNYGTSPQGITWRSGQGIFAFGNANCGTGMSGYLFDGSTLNKYSSKNSGYGGTTFGLVSSLNSDGTIHYNDGIVAPNLFNDGDATGKQTYSGSSLTFDRVGDTYTLSAATLANSNGQSNTLSGLQYFFNPSPTSGTIHTHIFTNNFWPMDPAASRTDALWGTYGNPGSFQGFTESNSYDWGSLPANFPVSDDGNAHNWFFGMNFAISFNLTADYEGPLEYYFFGDDDLWVFLDQTLVCDIGGVHSSVGEYVNLRDYLPVGSSGQHTLTFFYTERGASGSTCYMSFTLPSVSSATTAQDTGSLNIQKTLENASNVDYSSEEYQFRVELLTAEDGTPLNQTFSYSRSDGTFGTIKSGGAIALRQDESITISGIPAGTFYRVTELTTEGYTTKVNGNEGYIVSGTIATGVQAPASFVNTVITYALPDTGGGGTNLYTMGGLLLMTGAGILLLYNHMKRRKEDLTSS